MNGCLCLTEIAQHELAMLLQDAKIAIHGLSRQRKSVMQAVEAAQAAEGCHLDLSNEERVHVTRLLDCVRRLENTLDETMYELEQVEASLSSPEPGQIIAGPSDLTWLLLKTLLEMKPSLVEGVQWKQ